MVFVDFFRQGNGNQRILCLYFCIAHPVEMPFESLNEVFAYFGSPRIMYKPAARQFEQESVSEVIKNAFEDEVTSDLTIVAEGKKIFVHRIILKLRSLYFRLLLQEHWVEENQRVLEINQSYEAIYAYLRYIYTDEIEADPILAIELLELAEEYQDFDLKRFCEKSIQFGITVENVADLFIMAVRLDAKKLLKNCMLFATNHISEVIHSEGFSKWDQETMKEFILQCAKRKLFKS